MRVAFGLKAHSGWAALVVVGERDGGYALVDRRRIELVTEAWAKQPYHAPRELVAQGVAAAHRGALDQIRAALERERERNNEVAACAVLVGNPMPDWSVEQILAAHVRMHKAEGALFREALLSAARACRLNSVAIPDKQAVAAGPLAKIVTALGKQAGPPWGKDQKDAALAAILALTPHPASAPVP